MGDACCLCQAVLIPPSDRGLISELSAANPHQVISTYLAHP